MKKRLIASALVLIIALVTALPTFAAPITAPGSGSATLTYSVGSTYSISIPESISLEKVGNIVSGSGTLCVASGTLIDYGQELTVKVSGANTDPVNGFRLKNGDNNEFLNYDLKYGSAQNEINTAVTANDTEILAVAAGTVNEVNCYLSYTVTSDITVAGTFSDILTFTIGLGNA